MGILFDNDDKDDEYNRELESLPEGYEVRDGTIYDPVGNKLSLSYHNIDFPNAKLGAIVFHLIEHNGFFIPESKTRKVWELTLSKATDRYSELPKGYIEAVREYHSECPSRVKSDYNISKRIRKWGGKELYSGKEFDKDDHPRRDEVQDIIDNTVEKSDTEDVELDIDEDKLVLIIKAYVSGILKEESSDWMAISMAYEDLLYVLDEYISKENPRKSLQYAGSVIDIDIPLEEYANIQAYKKLNISDDPNNERLNRVQQKLEEELIWD